MEKKVKYNLSFTTGSLFMRESIVIAETYFKLRDWNKCKELVLKDNLIQSKKERSIKTITYEVVSRLKLLNESQIEIIVNGTKSEKLNILWIAICKKYIFIKDFAIEVIREKFINLNYIVNENDYNSFINSKVEWHEEISKITITTSKKIKQVLFRILKEVEILNNKNEIIPTLLSEKIITEIKKDKSINPSIFPITIDKLMEFKDFEA